MTRARAYVENGRGRIGHKGRKTSHNVRKRNAFIGCTDLLLIRREDSEEQGLRIDVP